MTNYANSLYAAEQSLGNDDDQKYENIWNSEIIFPIYAFKDASEFDDWILRYFESLAASYHTTDNRYSINDDTLLSLK